MRPASHQRPFEASEVAALCLTDVATIYTWVKRGEIAYFKTPGGRFRFRPEAVVDFLRRFGFPVPAELVDARARVIATDPDAASLTHVRNALGRTFEVVAFANAYDALLAIGAQKRDAIVMEAKLPSFDGVHCIRRIRAREELQHSRVVVFAANESHRQSCMDAGAFGFVVKPATDELRRTVVRALGMRESMLR